MDWEKVDRNDTYYKACVAALTVGGGVLGGAVATPVPGGTIPGYMAGAAWGLAIGYLACPYVAPGIKRKLQQAFPLEDLEAQQAAEAMGRYASVSDPREALRLVGLARIYSLQPGSAPACSSPALTARQLLAV